MNKFITSVTLLCICLLTSCSTINGFRGDPDTWGKKGKKEKSKKVVESKISQKNILMNQVKPMVKDPAAKSNRVNRFAKNKGRTVIGMIEPDVTRLPDNKDLQEANAVAPVPTLTTPKLKTAEAPLLTAPTDPFPTNE